MPGMQQNSPHTDRPFSQTQTDKKKSLHEYLTCPIRRRRVSSPRRCHVMSNSPFFCAPLPSFPHGMPKWHRRKEREREQGERISGLSFFFLLKTYDNNGRLAKASLFLGGLAPPSLPWLDKPLPRRHLLLPPPSKTPLL